MSNPLVSVIIPNYNYARYLPERMDSILNQTFQDYEIIVLDDCSTDNSREIIESYRSNPKVSHIIYNDTNSGSPFRQWEKGLSLAKGKYIWIAEADDSARPHLLEKTVQALESGDNVVLAMVMSRTIDADSNDTGQCRYDDCANDGTTHIYDGKEFIISKMLQANRCYNASMAVFRRDAWENISSKNYLNMRYCGDWMFWILIMQQGLTAIVQENLSEFRFHGHSVTDNARKMHSSTPEVWNTLFYNFNTFDSIPKHLKYYLTYSVLRVYKQKKFEFMRPERGSMSPEFEQFINNGLRNYPWYWIYKHWLHKVHKKMTDHPLTSLYTLK